MADKTSKLMDVETDHEYDGIREFDNPLPAWWLWTFAITVVFSVFYWIAYHSLPAEGSFDAHYRDMELYEQEMLSRAVTDEELFAIAGDAEAIAAGREHYVTNCASCHGDRGEGGIGGGANLTDAYWIHGQEPRDIWRVISFGEPLRGMPAWRPVLGDQRVLEVYAYVMTLKDTDIKGRAPEGVDAQGNRP